MDDSRIRNTVPDFTARGQVNGRWLNDFSIYEAKSSQPGTVITLSSFKGQTNGHIRNLAARHSAVIRYLQRTTKNSFTLNVSPSLTFVTTGGVSISPRVRLEANLAGIQINHFVAQYRIRGGVWQFYFGP